MAAVARRIVQLERTLRAAPRSMAASSFSTSAEEELIVNTEGSTGQLILNRPKALHALNPNMVAIATPVVQDWNTNDAVASFVMRSEPWGGKAFCAGGDVRAVYEDGLANETGTAGLGVHGSITGDFFRKEYELNYMLATCPKPQISLWDGIVMGGGVGLSVHGAFRVCSEKALFAMPETGIGLFPDVGLTYVLPRLAGAGAVATSGEASPIGVYLGLTGTRLKWGDLVYAGLATHAVASDKLQDMTAALAATPGPHDKATVQALLDEFAASSAADMPAEPAAIPEHLDAINKCFSLGTVEEILAALQAEAGGGGASAEWAAKTAKMMGKMSPTSMKVTLRMLREHASMPLDEVLKVEYRVAQRCMRPGSDFYEGIRGVLVDRGDPPATWAPAAVEEVSDDMVQEFFEPLQPNCELDLSPFTK